MLGTKVFFHGDPSIHDDMTIFKQNVSKKSRDNGNTDYYLTIFTGFCNDVRLYVDGKHVPTSQRQILNFYKLTIEKFRY